MLGPRRGCQPRSCHGLATGRADSERGYEAWALHIRGEVEARSGAAYAAVAEFHRQALALAQELGMRPLVARVHLALGQVGDPAGDGVAAST
ncbi:MAG: hypothetical protein ACREKJ_01405 [Candidatus Rokuibacteriota bacterium]